MSDPDSATSESPLTGHPLRTELNRLALLAAAGNARHAAILEQRLGWDGQGGADWSELADRHALPSSYLSRTAELCIERLRLHRVSSPVLDEVITAVNLTIPASAERIAAQLAELGLVDSAFDLRGIDTAGETLGKPRSWIVVCCGETRLLTDRHQQRAATLVTRALNKRLRTCGAARLDDVFTEIQANMARAPSARQFQELVDAQPGVAPLEQAPGWVWRRSVKKNPLVRNMAKVLAITPRIDMVALRQGLLRSLAATATCPPEEVLAAVCGAAFEARLENRHLSLARRLPARVFLDAREQTLVDLFGADRNVLTRKAIQTAWLDGGLNPGALDRLLRRAPFLEPLGRGLYALRGADVQPGEVAEVMQRRAPTRQVLDYGWREDGALWLTCRVTTTLLASGRLTLPTGLRPFFCGDVTVCDAGGRPLGRVACAASGALPLQAYLRLAEPRLDAILTLSFATGARRLLVRQEPEPQVRA